MTPVHTLQPLDPAVAERRLDRRLPCSQMVTLRLESGYELTGRMENISGSGAGVRIEAPIEPGTRISLSWGNQVFEGEVRHCTYEGMNYFAGILA